MQNNTPEKLTTYASTYLCIVKKNETEITQQQNHYIKYLKIHLNVKQAKTNM